ncbi:MAG: DNA repair exonuclease [Candidatus Odinarchaeum yellowstonii]|uniref:DNA repair exonuclease n=1 Tax=Odinarchaeota yellowstonii (strain LCB_4) TaxID=1841599 RepID=A0AAF0D280_ODILC|nr:MAG: DNA repair exonuclease [Candidatus Odinarchaeum yellowstonii]
MYKFAHIADCHLGANREPELRKLEVEAFKKSIDECLLRKVDFIIISGDIFHSNLPDMWVVSEAVRKMREAVEQGIRIYVVYGSHDYSPSETSIIDVLDSAGLVNRVGAGEIKDGSLLLKFTIDPKTKAKLTGISARKLGIEREYYTILDRDSLEREPGFKIFVFHTMISELKPLDLSKTESMQLSYLPSGFNYYAGGHPHKTIVKSFEGYPFIVYPGPLFAKDSKDFEEAAKGVKRGFYVVEFDSQVRNTEFIEVKVCDYYFEEYDATGKTPSQVTNDLAEKLRKADLNNKIVLLKVSGELASGKTADVDFTSIRRIIMERGALHARINRYGLTSKEYTSIKVKGSDVKEVEEKIFEENLRTVKLSNQKLTSTEGVKLALNLLKVLRDPPKVNESKDDYLNRIRSQALNVLGVSEDER